MREPRYTAWCFTLYYESEEVFNSILNFEKFKYVVFGEEICPTTKRNHLQGYFELFNKQGKKTLLKDFEKHDVSMREMFIFPRKGNQKQAVDYCKKGEQSHEEWEKNHEKGKNFGLNAKIHERGVPAKQGSRTDLDFIRTDALNNGMRQVTLTANAQQIRVAEKVLTYNESPRVWGPGESLNNTFIFGQSGCGKTFKAFELAGKDVYLYNPGIMGKWWEGYDGHETVIIDDVRPEHFRSATEILTLLHEFPTRVEQKGGSRQLKAKKIILTSILSPEQFWEHFPNEPFIQFKRRLTEVIEIQGSFRPGVISGPKYTILKNGPEESGQEVGGNNMEVQALPNPEEPDNIIPMRFIDDCPYCYGTHAISYYCKGQYDFDLNNIENSKRSEHEKTQERIYLKLLREDSIMKMLSNRLDKLIDRNRSSMMNK